jgi:hypothetical protein
MKWHWFVPVARYTELWRQGRKLLDRGLRQVAAAAYRPMQQVNARVLLSDLLANPDEWEAHLEELVIYLFSRKASLCTVPTVQLVRQAHLNHGVWLRSQRAQ